MGVIKKDSWRTNLFQHGLTPENRKERLLFELKTMLSNNRLTCWMLEDIIEHLEGDDERNQNAD